MEVRKKYSLRKQIKSYLIFTLQGIEYRCGQYFQHSFRPALGPTQPPIKWVSDVFTGGNMTGAWG